MKNIFKRSAGSDTPLNQNRFRKAVIQLTAYYTAGVFAILVIFNIAVYALFSNSIQPHDSDDGMTFSREYRSDDLGESRIEELQENLLNILLVSDAGILLFVVIAAYILSKKTLTPLEESYQRQRQFMADAAHELRTPLAVMQAGSEVVLRSARTPGEYRAFISESLDEVKRLTVLTNDLLFLARTDHRKSLNHSKVLLSDLISKQVEIIRAYAESKKVTLHESCADMVFVMGAHDDLVRLVVNLLKNAIDYNKEDGNVSVTLVQINHKAVLTVEDTGIGIAAENKQYIFERFYKVDNARVENATGSGLGLAIVRDIVDEHQGSIDIASTLGKGTTVQVILPCV